MLNRQVFDKDPTSYTLPNEGVAKVAFPSSDQEWQVARYELESFVCKGAYQQGLVNILRGFLDRVEQPTQAAVWVHGFYGSGKSHLLRVLQFLWQDVEFPDGAKARTLVRQLPGDVTAALKELDSLGRRYGGTWAAAGSLGSGTSDNPRLAFLQVVLRAAGLPERVNLARFDIFLRTRGVRERVEEGLRASGKDYRRELAHLFVSTHLHAELAGALPELGRTPAEVAAALRAQFGGDQNSAGDLTTAGMVDLMHDVFQLVSARPPQPPLVLLILDELQQYLAHLPQRSSEVLDAMEECARRFGGKLLVVAAGQSALTPDTPMNRLQGRFPIHVALSDREVETVLRETVLRKKTNALSPLKGALSAASGEIHRHLGGSRLQHRHDDDDNLAADYPVLPTRRRFWERVLSAVDQAGASQLRTQLRMAFDAARATADQPLGNVVGADFLFDQLRTSLVEKQVLLRDVEQRIAEQDDGTDEGRLKARACGLIFLIDQLPVELGVRATADTLADLMVTDLTAGSASLRQKLPGLLRELVDSGVLSEAEGSYRLQSREGQEWEADFRKRRAAIVNDPARVGPERDKRLQALVHREIGSLSVNQGVSKTPRRIAVSFDAHAPAGRGPDVPVWVRTGWDVDRSAVERDARAAGPESPVVFVFIPPEHADELREAIAGVLAADEVLQTRPQPATEEGRQARLGMESRRNNHDERVTQLLKAAVASACVYKAGGEQVEESSFADAVQQAVQDAASRLFPEFGKADHDSWDRVAERARRGDPDALAEVGHKKEARAHPVCRAVLEFLSSGQQTGSRVRERFAAPPYGWPQDAVDAALIVLCQSGDIRARDASHRELSCQQLHATAIRSATFVVEQQPVGAEERIAIRTMLHKAGVTVKPGDELQGVRQLAERLREAARNAGGDPPLPPPPASEIAAELGRRDGNDLLRIAYDRQSEILDLLENWEEVARRAQERLRDWNRLQSLLRHAGGLPGCRDARQQADAILNGRSLLQEPDPLPPLLAAVSGALRQALTEAHRRWQQQYDHLTGQLEGEDDWQRLSEEQRRQVLEDSRIAPQPVPSLGTDDELLAALEVRSLQGWAELADALPGRVAEARAAAARLLAPKTVRVQAPPATIRTEEELERYLEQLRQTVLERLRAGSPVVLP